MPSPFTPVMRANSLSTRDAGVLPLLQRQFLNNCNNTLCYTYNHNYVYKPHTGYGKVGTSSAGYLASRKRL
jgi:hypothetical protein